MEVTVLYPCPTIGHLVSMVELGKFILTHYPSLSVHILITTLPINIGRTASYVEHVCATVPSITFHSLPAVTPALDPSSYPNTIALIIDLLRRSNPHVCKTLQSIILAGSTIRAIVIDFFCTPVLDIAAELNLPAYYFFSSSASALALHLYFPTMAFNLNKSYEDRTTILYVPGLPPLTSSDMPQPIPERTTNECYLYYMTQLPKSTGIIVNTFESLELNAVNAVSSGLCVPNGPTPLLFCVGPLIASDGQSNSDRAAECLSWLDSQPSRSVIFVCFGSMGLFSIEQLKEIAIGLERSGQRFLWVVRSPHSESQTMPISAPQELELDSLLPDGFLDRTKKRGLVVKSWAPQVAVLNHDSIGGFMTHCGWNSVLEAVCAGVPMVAWPLYAEQPVTGVCLVEEMKIALPITRSEEGFVSAAEVEKRVRELMDSGEGNSIRELVMAKRDEAMTAMSNGGSSQLALAKLVESWQRGKVAKNDISSVCPSEVMNEVSHAKQRKHADYYQKTVTSMSISQ